MRVLAIDFETSGLEPSKDRIIEIGCALWDTDRKVVLEAAGFLLRLPIDVKLDPVITKLTGITPGDLEEFGGDLPDSLLRIARSCVKAGVSRLVGHNAKAFDRAFLLAEIGRLAVVPPEVQALAALPWLDTMTDLPVPEEMKARKLVHMAADHGFLNPFPHRALFDALTCLRLLSSYPFDEVVRYADAPVVTLSAWGLPFDRKQEAKDAGFSWDATRKVWFRKVKDFQVAEVRAGLTFPVREEPA